MNPLTTSSFAPTTSGVLRGIGTAAVLGLAVLGIVFLTGAVGHEMKRLRQSER